MVRVSLLLWASVRSEVCGQTLASRTRREITDFLVENWVCVWALKMAYTRLEATEARRVDDENELVWKTNKNGCVLSHDDTLGTVGLVQRAWYACTAAPR